MLSRDLRHVHALASSCVLSHLLSANANAAAMDAQPLAAQAHGTLYQVTTNDWLGCIPEHLRSSLGALQMR